MLKSLCALTRMLCWLVRKKEASNWGINVKHPVSRASLKSVFLLSKCRWSENKKDFKDVHQRLVLIFWTAQVELVFHVEVIFTWMMLFQRFQFITDQKHAGRRGFKRTSWNGETNHYSNECCHWGKKDSLFFYIFQVSFKETLIIYSIICFIRSVKVGENIFTGKQTYVIYLRYIDVNKKVDK